MIPKRNETAQLSIFNRFEELLPNRPYCSEDLSAGLVIRGKRTAIKFRYIQPNPPAMCHWLVFDLDHDNPLIWEEVGLPEPNFITRNPDNLRCHVVYAVDSVCTSDAAKPKPIAFMAAIQAAYTQALKADLGYAGFITKNPLNPHWHVAEIHRDVYTLAELADSVELDRHHWTRKRAANDDQYGLGRNCALFHRVRYWAYDHVNSFKAEGGAFEAWHSAVLERCEAFNTFPEPLQYGELKSTAKSVAKWVWTKYTGKGSGKRRGLMSDTFKASQIPLDLKAKQHFAALKTNENQRLKTEKRISAAIAAIRAKGERVTKAGVARDTGVSREIISRKYPHLFES